MLCDQDNKEYSDDCFCTMHGLTNMEKVLTLQGNDISHSLYKEWMCELLDNASARNALLNNNEHYTNVHPCEKEHLFFANKLFDFINSDYDNN